MPPLTVLVKSLHYLCYTLAHVHFFPLQTKEANHNGILIMGLSSQIKNVCRIFLEHLRICNHDRSIISHPVLKFCHSYNWEYFIKCIHLLNQWFSNSSQSWHAYEILFAQHTDVHYVHDTVLSTSTLPVPWDEGFTTSYISIIIPHIPTGQICFRPWVYYVMSLFLCIESNLLEELIH